MIPQRISPLDDPCELGRKWIIDQRLASSLVRMASMLPFGISIISGYRTKEQQDALRAQGRPAAPDYLSTHRSCPATGADLRPDVAVTTTVKAELGHAATVNGLRWGGGSPLDENYQPEDWNHVDLGPRRSS